MKDGKEMENMTDYKKKSDMCMKDDKEREDMIDYKRKAR